ncbi:MAG: hypothetical protein QW648_01390 [Nanoarchaeales archaeon]
MTAEQAKYKMLPLKFFLDSNENKIIYTIAFNYNEILKFKNNFIAKVDDDIYLVLIGYEEEIFKIHDDDINDINIVVSGAINDLYKIYNYINLNNDVDKDKDLSREIYGSLLTEVEIYYRYYNKTMMIRIGYNVFYEAIEKKIKNIMKNEKRILSSDEVKKLIFEYITSYDLLEVLESKLKELEMLKKYEQEI